MTLNTAEQIEAIKMIVFGNIDISCPSRNLPILVARFLREHSLTEITPQRLQELTSLSLE